MRYQQPGDGPLPQRPDYAQRVEEFPGPVAIACTQPADTIALCGAEDSDGHPWALEVTYAAPGRDRLQVRTVRGSIDWPQTIRSLETLAANLSVFGLSGAEAPAEIPTDAEVPTSVVIDGAPVPGTRIDLPDRSGVRLEWQGQHVFCIGERQLIDGVELRAATGADFARIIAEFDEFVARRRSEG